MDNYFSKKDNDVIIKSRFTDIDFCKSLEEFNLILSKMEPLKCVFSILCYRPFYRISNDK